jgi:hypothetical protein
MWSFGLWWLRDVRIAILPTHYYHKPFRITCSPSHLVSIVWSSAHKYLVRVLACFDVKTCSHWTPQYWKKVEKFDMTCSTSLTCPVCLSHGWHDSYWHDRLYFSYAIVQRFRWQFTPTCSLSYAPTPILQLRGVALPLDHCHTYLTCTELT